MKDAMAEAGLKEPVFEANGFFRAVFHRSAEFSLKRSEEPAEVVSKGGQTSGQIKWSELSEKRRAVLEVIKKNPMISRENISEFLGINQSAVQKHIERLKSGGFLRRVGPDMGGHWDVPAEVVRTGGQIKWSELSEKQRAVLEVIKKDPTISRENISEFLGINQSAVQKHIERLKSGGFLRRVGPDMGGHWDVLPEGP
jgi:predicted HTH transcriptional regulator